jgi:drug/metabolite transporter (DMT)-like permease
MLLIIALYGLFASSLFISKVLVENYTQPIFYTGIRMIIGGSLLLGYQYFNPRQQFVVKRKHLWLYAQLIIFSILITYILRFWGLQSLPAYKASFLHNLSPFITSFYSYFIFQEKMTKKQWLGLGIGLLGMIPILLTSSPDEQKLGEFLYISWPELAIIGCVVAQSYGWIIMRKLLRDKSYSPMMINGISMTMGGIIALGLSVPVEGFAPVDHWAGFLFWLMLAILVSNIICTNLYGHLLRSYTATFLSFAGFLTVIFSAFYEWFGSLLAPDIFQRHITWHFYASCLVVFIGLYLFYKDELNQHNKVQETPQS